MAIFVQFLGASEGTALPTDDSDQELFESQFSQFLATGEQKHFKFKAKKQGKQFGVYVRFDAIVYMKVDEPKTEWTIY